MSRRGYANLAEHIVIKNVIIFDIDILKFNQGVLNDMQKKIIPMDKILDELICGKKLGQKKMEDT